MRLFEILTADKTKASKKEKKEDNNLRVISQPATALLAGRPSANIKSLKQRAESDPAGLISDLGIEPNPSDSFSEFLHNCFTQMISSATGNKKARMLQDLFDKPEIVKSSLKGKKAILIKLSAEGLELAKESPRKFLRTYAFWFSSTTEALEKTNSRLNLNLTNYVKFQYIKSESAIIIYKSPRAWSSL
tara:strand:+ start:21 stop:587 length:567 start_codon:yes stop_codon:yes gene_type:complete